MIASDPCPALAVASDHEAVIARHSFGLGEVSDGNSLSGDLQARGAVVRFLIDHPRRVRVFRRNIEYLGRAQAIWDSEVPPIFPVESGKPFNPSAPQDISVESKSRCVSHHAFREVEIFKDWSTIPTDFLDVVPCTHPDLAIGTGGDGAGLELRLRIDGNLACNQRLGIKASQAAWNRERPHSTVAGHGYIARDPACQSISFHPSAPAMLPRGPHRHAVAGCDPQSLLAVAQHSPYFGIGKSFFIRPTRPCFGVRPAVDSRPAKAEPDGPFAILERSHDPVVTRALLFGYGLPTAIHLAEQAQHGRDHQISGFIERWHPRVVRAGKFGPVFNKSAGPRLQAQQVFLRAYP